MKRLVFKPVVWATVEIRLALPSTIDKIRLMSHSVHDRAQPWPALSAHLSGWAVQDWWLQTSHLQQAVPCLCFPNKMSTGYSTSSDANLLLQEGASCKKLGSRALYEFLANHQRQLTSLPWRASNQALTLLQPPQRVGRGGRLQASLPAKAAV